MISKTYGTKRSKTKLTLVSVYCKGRTISVFLPLVYREGKPVVDMSTLNHMLAEIGVKPEQAFTFSIG
jgi:hypothetical protein